MSPTSEVGFVPLDSIPFSSPRHSEPQWCSAGGTRRAAKQPSSFRLEAEPSSWEWPTSRFVSVTGSDLFLPGMQLDRLHERWFRRVSGRGGARSRWFGLYL